MKQNAIKIQIIIKENFLWFLELLCLELTYLHIMGSSFIMALFKYYTIKKDMNIYKNDTSAHSIVISCKLNWIKLSIFRVLLLYKNPMKFQYYQWQTLQIKYIYVYKVWFSVVVFASLHTSEN